jgi:peptidoglycan/LPS O-acetylase OafA/YrhL
LKQLTRILLFLIPVLWIYRSALHFGGVSDAYIYTSFETRVDAILVGCLFAIGIHTRAAARFLSELRRPLYLPLTVAFLIASIYGDSSVLFYRDVIGFAIEPLVVMTLIAQLIALRSGYWMDSKPISYLGRISYSTYLYQQLVIPVIIKAVPGLPHAAKAACCVLGTWLVSAISYQIVEKPFLHLKEHFTSLSTQRPRDLTSA